MTIGPMNEDDLRGRLDFVRRAEGLKDTLRNAFTSQGRTESVADHTWRLMLLAITFADLLPSIDLLRLLRICILHDLGEAIDGDIPAPQQRDLPGKAEKERADFATLTQPLPQSVREEFLSLWDEYEDALTPEAKAAKAYDKLETLLQHTQGQNPSDFDYSFNLHYGREQTNAVPLIAKLRTLVDQETESRRREEE